jgi:hypothetical protein
LRLKNNEIIVKIACDNDEYALEYASNELRAKDQQGVLRLRKKYDIIKIACNNNCKILQVNIYLLQLFIITFFIYLLL